MLSPFEEAAELYTIIDKKQFERSAEERKIGNIYYFYLKCWDNYGANLGKGQDIIFKLSQLFPADQRCRTKFPMGNFKALAGSTHEEIYNKWVARYHEPMIDFKGRNSSIIRFAVAYTIKKYEELYGQIITPEEVRKAISLNLYRSAKGLVLEDIVNEMLTEQYANHPRLEYKPATAELEHLDVDGILCWRESGEIIRYYSIKCLKALKDENILKKRYGMREGLSKLTPTHYAGLETIDSKTIITKYATDFPRPENLESLRRIWNEEYSY